MTIQEGGLELAGINITIVNTSFGSVEHKGICLISDSIFWLTNNTFINLQGPSSLGVYGYLVTVTGNKFKSFPNCFAIPDLKQFAGNEFEILIFKVPLATTLHETQKLYNNSFQSDCSDDFSSTLISLHRQGLGHILKNTFCISRECPRSITHITPLHRQSAESLPSGPEMQRLVIKGPSLRWSSSTQTSPRNLPRRHPDVCIYT